MTGQELLEILKSPKTVNFWCSYLPNKTKLYYRASFL